MKYVEIYLPYFKQGDDFQGYFDNTGNAIDACKCHAQALRHGAEQLEHIASVLADHADDAIEVEGQTHMIWMHLPDNVADILIGQGLAQEDTIYDELNDVDE